MVGLSIPKTEPFKVTSFAFPLYTRSDGSTNPTVPKLSLHFPQVTVMFAPSDAYLNAPCTCANFI